MLGGTWTLLGRGFGLAAGSADASESPLTTVDDLLATEDPLRGFAVLGREWAALLPSARTDAADAGRRIVGRDVPGISNEVREVERERVPGERTSHRC